jgi:hypothetical protein
MCNVERTLSSKRCIRRACFDRTVDRPRSITSCPREFTREKRSRAVTTKITRLFDDCCCTRLCVLRLGRSTRGEKRSRKYKRSTRGFRLESLRGRDFERARCCIECFCECADGNQCFCTINFKSRVMPRRNILGRTRRVIEDAKRFTYATLSCEEIREISRNNRACEWLCSE